MNALPPPSSGSRVIAAATAIAFVLAASAVVVHTLSWTARLWHPLPFFDQWSWIADVRDLYEGHWSPARLWEQHNEHRLLVPRLFFLVDLWLFDARNWFLLVCIAAIQAAHVALLWGMARAAWRGGLDAARAPTALGAIALGWVAICEFSSVQMDNFTFGFQVQFVLVYMAATSAFALLGACSARPAGARRRLLLAGTLLAGFVSTGSMANGVLVWPVLALLGWRLRLRRGESLLVLATGALAIAAYLQGYATPAHEPAGSPLHGLTEPLRAGLYVLAYLGSPLRLHGLAAAIAAGAVGVALAAAMLARAWRSTAAVPQRLALGGVLLFVLGTACITALGRVHFDVQHALSSRYATAALAFWSALGLLLLDAVARAPWRTVAASVVAGLFAFTGLLLAEQRSAARELLPRYDDLQRTTMALWTGVADRRQVETLHELPADVLLPLMESLREERLSVFATGEHELMGQPLAARFDERPPGSAARGGTFDGVDAVAGTTAGVRVHGHVRGDGRILLVDATGRIAGFAAPSAAGDGTFAGYAHNPDLVDKRLSAFAVEADGRTVSPLAGSHEAWVRAAVEVDPRALGEAVDGRWHLVGTFVQREQAASADSPELLWSSRSGGSGGTLGFGPFVAAGRLAVGVPLRLGARASRIRVRVTSATGETTFAELVRAPPREDPWVWRAELPEVARGALLALFVEDGGDGDDEWVEVGVPRWIR